MRDINHFIDGASFTGASGRFSDVFNPNTGEVQARVQLATAGELDMAVQDDATVAGHQTVAAELGRRSLRVPPVFQHHAASAARNLLSESKTPGFAHKDWQTK